MTDSRAKFLTVDSDTDDFSQGFKDEYSVRDVASTVDADTDDEDSKDMLANHYTDDEIISRATRN